MPNIHPTYISPDDISEDAQLTDHIHKFGRLARSYHVVGRHRGLKNMYFSCVCSLKRRVYMKGSYLQLAIFSIYLYPVHEDVGISFLAVLDLLLFDV